MSRYAKANHTVYISFFFRGGWHVQFREIGLETPFPKKLTFTAPERSGSWHGEVKSG
jgi:hypothetical protein